ncbi:MAG TPA: Rieske 2Fe-2S domain-containing protein [Acidimicrobiales bacterium]|nr:Rieske 2Fe-2S domain-containing protein [Acidimicrobiales bacterium]
MSEHGPGVQEGFEGAFDGEENGTPVPVSLARWDDPHMQVAARDPKKTERLIMTCFVVGILGVAGFGAVFWVSPSPNYYWLYGLTLGVGFFFLGFGLTAWGKYLMPQGPFVEERHVLAGTDEERDAMAAAVVQRTDVVLRRRGFLGALLAAGVAIFSVVAVFPLLRSLGPLPKKSLFTTNWRRGSLLVDVNGTPVHVDSMVVGGIQTVFPQGPYRNDPNQAAKDQTVLLRPNDSAVATGKDLPKGRTKWVPHGYIAYSQVCTHLGCPVKLYEEQLELLVCPCHQSMFNIRNGAVPQFGPAARPLPQLPLMVDGNGYLRAAAGYDQAVGPSFWERTTHPEWHW